MSFLDRVFGSGMTGGRKDISGDDAVVRFRGLLGRLAEWEELPETSFAMWQPSGDDADFSKSPIIRLWTNVYVVTVGCWSFVTADLLKTLRVVEGTMMRLGLPEQNQSFPFFTNTGEPAVLSLSQEKGIRFHFAQNTTLAYRVMFLEAFLAYCRALQQSIQRVEGLHENPLGFEEWWVLTAQTASMVSAQKPMTGIGIIKR